MTYHEKYLTFLEIFTFHTKVKIEPLEGTYQIIPYQIIEEETARKAFG